MTTKTTDLTDAERVARRDLAEARQLRTDLLADFAAGKDVQAQLDEVDAEIASTQRQLARFADAKAAQARAGTVTAKLAAHEQIVSQLADGVLGAEKVAAMSQDVLATLATLAVQLEALDVQRITTTRALLAAAYDTQHGTTERMVDNMQHVVRTHVNALTLPTPFLLALRATGIGENKGVVLPREFVDIDIKVPAVIKNNKPDIAADIASALKRVHADAAKIESWSAQANGATKEVA